MSTIARQMCSAIGAAPIAGIVPRDDKPANVFLVPERGAMAGLRVKILDFGVAKVTEASGSGHSFTRADSMLGTPHYMSPEQCRGAGGVDWRSDIYAIGCIVFEMLTGRKVFIAQGLGELLAMHQRQPPPTLSSLDPATPPELDYLVARLLAKRAEERPQSLEEVENLLEQMAAAYGWDAMWSRTTGSVPAMPLGRMGFPGAPSFSGQIPSQSGAAFHSYGGGVMYPSHGSAPLPGVVMPISMTPGSAPNTLGNAAAEVGAAPRPRRTALWVAAAVLVVGLGGGGAYVALRGGGGATAATLAETAPPSTTPTTTPAATAPPPPPPAAPPPAALVVAATPDAALAAPPPAATASTAPDAAVAGAMRVVATYPPDAGVPVPDAPPPEAEAPAPEPAVPAAAPVEPAKPRPKRPKKPQVEL
jgi:serine/threonine-protein kinase